ncbi:hypothetical protein Tco_0825041 [Tanacetum coccineum]
MVSTIGANTYGKMGGLHNGSNGFESKGKRPSLLAGALRATNELIDLRLGDSGTKSWWGLTADVVECQMKNSLESLRSERVEYQRLATVLILKLEYGVSNPTKYDVSSSLSNTAYSSQQINKAYPLPLDTAYRLSYPESYDGEDEMLDEGENWGIDPLEFLSNGTDISQKDEKPSKNRQKRTRDGKVCENEAKSKSSQLREEKAEKNIT